MRLPLSWFVLVWAGMCTANAAEALTIPRVEKAPLLDGDLGDACWKDALVLNGFTKPKSTAVPRKGIEARLLCDAHNLYIAVRCAEPEPAKIRAQATQRNNQVWTDDCVEVFIRASANKLDFDQFIVNPVGTQEDVRMRNGQRDKPAAAWDAKAAKSADAWSVEFKLTTGDVGLDGFRRGDRLGLKLGREDRAGAGEDFAVWPAGAPYAGFEDYAPVFVEDANCVAHPALEDAKGWSSDKDAQGVFSSADDAGVKVLKIVSPNRYATISQDLRLRPGMHYKVSAEISASGPMTVRIRAPQADQKKGESGKPFDIRAEKSDGYALYQARFQTGPEGKALLIVGVNEGSGTGEFLVRKLRVTRVDAPASSGLAIPVKAGAEPLVVKKLLVTDCRAVRGFIGAPVDGSLKSGQWDGGNWEYNQPGAGAGVGYGYLKGDGLHITLADKDGFNAVVVRGGVRAKLCRDVAKYDDAKSGTLVCEFPGQSESSRAYFENPVRTGKVSFFEVGDGYIADCSFFRLGGVFANAAEGSIDFSAFDDLQAQNSDALRSWIVERFPGVPRILKLGQPTGGLARKETEANCEGLKDIHLVLDGLSAETSLAALTLTAEVETGLTHIPFSIRVQDPLNPRLELHGADYELDRAGRVQVVCDFPDQIVPRDSSIWIALQFGLPVKLKHISVKLHATSREQAAPEALAHRLFLLRGFYSAMSEARPWNGFHKPEDIDALLKKPGNPYASWVGQILDTLGQCRMIDRNGKDETVRQYYQWIYRNILRRSAEGTPPFATRFDKADGVPEWAVLARQAWLQARGVAKWWLDHRSVPTGEFGGVVGDDTDLLMNFGPLPMFERDGVAGELLAAGTRLAAYAQLTTLTEGLNSHTMDPLHAYEEGMNLDAQMLWWFYGDPVCVERCLVAARSLEKITVLTPKGHRHFRSQDLGAADLKMKRKTDTDGGAHCLMWHPALSAAWYNAHPRVLKTLREWGDGWLEHYKECETGKYPETIEVATETVKTTGAEPFPGVWGMEASVFMSLAQVSGEAKYIKPYLDLITTGKQTGHVRTHTPELAQLGMLDIPVEKLAPDILARQWNAALYLKGDKAPLIAALKNDIEELQRFQHMYTTVECFTDRVFLYALINPSICYTGGYATRNKLNHNFAVSWEGLGTDYAALVLDAKPNHLKVLICNLGTQALRGTMRVWRLAHGDYELTFGLDANQDDAADAVKKETRTVAKGDGLAIDLPHQGVYVLELKQIKALEDLKARADLALSPQEVKLEGGKVRGVIHNIGVMASDEVEVALLDAAGKIVARKALGALAAPLDLVPRTAAFEFDGVPADAKGWALAVDPEAKILEIFEGNNRVPLVR